MGTGKHDVFSPRSGCTVTASQIVNSSRKWKLSALPCCRATVEGLQSRGYGQHQHRRHSGLPLHPPHPPPVVVPRHRPRPAQTLPPPPDRHRSANAKIAHAFPACGELNGGSGAFLCTAPDPPFQTSSAEPLLCGGGQVNRNHFWRVSNRGSAWASVNFNLAPHDTPTTTLSGVHTVRARPNYHRISLIPVWRAICATLCATLGKVGLEPICWHQHIYKGTY